MTNNRSSRPVPSRGRRKEKRTSTRKVTRRQVEKRGKGGRKLRKFTYRRTVRVETSIVETWDQVRPRDAASSPLASVESNDAVAPGFPNRWKLSVKNVRGRDGRPAAELEGDYILDCVYRDRKRARWEHVFPARHGLFRVSLDMESRKGREPRWTAEFSGIESGPRWRRAFHELSPRMSLPRAGSPANFAGLSWPAEVELTPLGVSGSLQPLSTPSASYERLPASLATRRATGSF
jgi:hypothetical protein